MFLMVRDLKKVYGSGRNQTPALRSINFGVNQGEFVAIMGESGSGKSTLLNIIATLDTPTSGYIVLDGKPLNQLPEKEFAKFRREKLGFVFQDFNLLNTLSNKDNIFLPLVLSNRNSDLMEMRLSQIVPLLGIGDLLNKFPYEISGGEKQRVAIARALITEPAIVLADEPTGSLDSRTSQAIMELFYEIHRRNQTVLMVTHSIVDASYANRVLFIKDGMVYHELYKGSDDSNTFREKISDSLSMLNARG